MPPPDKPMHRNRPLVRPTPMTVKLRKPPIPKQVKVAVLRRAGGLCDMCGKPVRDTRWDPHHRKLRSQGGQDDTANLLCTHRTCHDRIHANPAWAYRAGLLVRSHDDPATRPVWHRDTRWRLAGEREWVGCEAPTDDREDVA